AGLPNVSNNKVAVYVDGQLNSTFFSNNFTGFSVGPRTLFLGFPAGQGTDSRNIALDELRIWNTADPTPTSLVLANSLENSSLISSVGSNGTFIAGTFVNGAVGNALATTTPEPDSLFLLGSGLVALLYCKRTKGLSITHNFNGEN